MNKNEFFNNPQKKPRVLVAPLDWGLGHATRCIPIIFKLLQQNCEVIVAAEGPVKFLLQKEFPGLFFMELKGYRMQYSRNKWWLPAKLLLQFPKLIYRIYAEKKWLAKTIDACKIDAVIADNRLGLSHKKIPCIYITHQLLIKTGNRFTENIAQKIHYLFINRFNACWVPDAEGEINLAGDLSHPVVLPRVPVKYLGPLSRFKKTAVEIKYDLCILLSGPEPQRTVFENLIFNDVRNFKGRVMLLRGLPGTTPEKALNNPALEIRNHLPAAALNEVLLQSKLIICRSGYTSVMDLVKLQKKAILVPTPGQTEQEYLAGYLQKQKLFLSAAQKHFSLPAVLKDAAGFECKELSFSPETFEAVIEEFVRDINRT